MLEQLRKKRIEISKSIQKRPRVKSKQRRQQIEASLQQFKRQKYSRPASPIKSAHQFYPSDSRKINIPKNPFQTHQQFPSFGKSDQKIFIPTQINKENKIDIEEPKNQDHIEQNIEDSPKKKQMDQKNIQQQILKQQKIQKQEKPEQKKAEQPLEIEKQKNEKLNNQKNQNEPELEDHGKNSEVLQKQLHTQLAVIVQSYQSIPNNVEQQAPQQAINDQKKQKKVQFDLPQFSGGLISPVNTSEVKNFNNLEPTYTKKAEEESLNFNYNQSNYALSSNNSSAILFTSQFKQYLNRDKTNNNSPKKQQSNQNMEVQEQKQSTHNNKSQKYVSESFLKIGEDDVSEETEQRKRMKHNQSGRSLAFSNSHNQESSMLKYSHPNSNYNQSTVQNMVNKKLDEELILQIGDFSRSKFLQVVNRYLDFITQNNSDTLNQLKIGLVKYGRIIKLVKSFELIELRNGFQEILIFSEDKFEMVKNQIKADHFLEDKKDKLRAKILQEWKNINDINEAKAIGFQLRKNAAFKKNIFKVFRMIWFDAKVGKQADLYYLSKIFTAWRNAAYLQKKKNNHIALKQYCRSLKRFYFYKIMEGTDNMRRERQNEEAAQNLYCYSLRRKFFDAWANSIDKQPQYISLAMTSKNAFKQTADHKWLQVKTVDFKQIKF